MWGCIQQHLVCNSRARMPGAACLSLQDGQGSGSASDQARGSDNAQPPLPQEADVDMADPLLLPVTEGVAGDPSTQRLSGLRPAPDPLLDSWGDAAPSRSSKKRSPESSDVGDNGEELSCVACLS